MCRGIASGTLRKRVQPVDEELIKRASLRPMRFVSHTIGHGGVLYDLPGAHACWYYCRIAIQAMKKVDDGADYEGERDHVNALNNIARSVAALYRLESPSEFLKFMAEVKVEAMRCQLEWDRRIEDPWKAPHIKVGN